MRKNMKECDWVQVNKVFIKFHLTNKRLRKEALALARRLGEKRGRLFDENEKHVFVNAYIYNRMVRGK